MRIVSFQSSVMNQSGEALMGCGIASGDNRAIEAAQKAISSPLLEGVNIRGAKNILLNVTGSTSLTMQEVEEGNKVIYEAAGEEANVIFGLVNKEEMNEYVSYTVIATGFSAKGAMADYSSQVSRENKEKVRKIYSGGFPMKKFDFEKEEDLDIPTIFRVKGSKSGLRNDENVSSSGIYDQIDAFENDEDLSRKEKKEEDSSSFLKMMMD